MNIWTVLSLHQHMIGIFLRI